MNRHRGFTLIELVISAALMSMILGGAYACFRASLASQKLVEAREEVLQNARVAMALMTADLRNACPLSKDFDFLGSHRLLGDTQADNLDFATHNYTPRHEQESDWCEVSYFLDPDRNSGRFSLWRRRDTTPDNEPLSGGSREEIAQGLRGLKFDYYDGLDWYEDWGDVAGAAKAESSFKARPNLTGLPEAVRITLWFDSNPHGKKENAEKNEASEPPLVFQTVVRLNLTSVSARTTATGSSTNGPASPTSSSPVPGPGGVQ